VSSFDYHNNVGYSLQFGAVTCYCMANVLQTYNKTIADSLINVVSNNKVNVINKPSLK